VLLVLGIVAGQFAEDLQQSGDHADYDACDSQSPEVKPAVEKRSEKVTSDHTSWQGERK
jgi:hypothetical protein